MTWRPTWRLGAALLGMLLVLGMLVAVAAPARARGPEPAPAPVTGDLAEPTVVATAAEADDVRDYWTRRRMEAALPLGLDELGDPTSPGTATPSRTAARTTARAGLTAPRSVGKLFFTMPEGDAVCSAAAVNTPQRNVIITAAHCAHSGDGSCGLLGCTAGQYFTNFLFVPRYANGSGPDGKWVGARAVTHSQWISSEDMGYDQALIEMHPNAGRRLVDVVGGNGLAWGYPPREADVAVWGWPAEPPYDGERVHVCTGSTDSFEGSADAGIACPMTGGSSGGPWFLAMVNRDVGFIWAVTSRRTVLGPRVLIARPLSAEIRRLISVVNARPVAPRSTAPRTAARRGKVRIRAVRRHVGRGQAIQLRVRTKAGARVVLQVRKSRRGKWKRVTVGRTNSARTVEFRLHAKKAGLRWYRARTKRGISRPVRLRVHPCPFPLDRSPAVVQATGCSSPLR